MEINSELRFETFLSKPDIRVGQSSLVGTENKWDKLAINRTHVEPQPNDAYDDTAALVPSGFSRFVVTEIYPGFEPNEGSKINSWLTHGDYSEHPDFHPVWRVEVREYELWYNLADILIGICGMEV